MDGTSGAPRTKKALTAKQQATLEAI